MTARWVYGTNVPGYLPDSDPAEPMPWEDAKGALIGELELDADGWDERARADGAPETEVDTLNVEACHANAEDLSSTAEDLNLVSEPADGEYSVTVAGRAYWLQRAAD